MDADEIESAFIELIRPLRREARFEPFRVKLALSQIVGRTTQQLAIVTFDNRYDFMSWLLAQEGLELNERWLYIEAHWRIGEHGNSEFIRPRRWNRGERFRRLLRRMADSY